MGNINETVFKTQKIEYFVLVPLRFVCVNLSYLITANSLLKCRELQEIYRDNTCAEIIGKIYSAFEQVFCNGKDTEVCDRR